MGLCPLMNTAAPNTTKPTRFHYVDLIRGFAAIAVLVTHYRWFYANRPGDWGAVTTQAMPWSSILWPLYDYGGLAVQLFWVLSGFVFALNYGPRAKKFSFRQFAGHRIARLYPLHVITLGFVGVLQYISLKLYGQPQIYGNNDVVHFIAQLGFASNWFTIQSSFNGPVWSISVEVLIYVIFAIYISRFRLAGVPVAILVSIFFIFERLTHSPIAWCGALFFIGAGTFMISERLYGLAGKWSIAGAIVSCAVVAAGIAVSVMLGYGGHEDVLIAYFMMPCLILCVSLIDWTGVHFSSKLIWIGDSTYAIYMCHMPIIILAKIFVPQWFSNHRFLAQPYILVAYVCLVIVVAYPIFRFVEKPSQNWLREMFRKKDHRSEIFYSRVVSHRAE